MLEFSITEIYRSIQGESTWAGVPCTFVRLAGCPLRCRWCDTVYSFKQGESHSIAQIIEKIAKFEVPLVELTGGEPLAQRGVEVLAEKIIDRGYTLLIETGGSFPIQHLPKETRIIMDIKCPGSGMEDRNCWENIDYLQKKKDEIKFVVASKEDFDWACSIVSKFSLCDKASVLISPAWGLVPKEDLVSWILESGLKLRLNLQLHKFIWSPKKRGV